MIVKVEKEYLDKLLEEIKILKIKNSEYEDILKTREVNGYNKMKNNIKRNIIIEKMYKKYLETGLHWYNIKDSCIEGEIWKEINGASGYFVSNFGRVKSNRHPYGYPEIFLILQKQRFGYLRAGLHVCGKTKAVFVHRLVAIQFTPNYENKTDVNHINGRKEDNRVDNLEWATESENIRHAYDTGLNSSKIGEDHNMAKLTEADVFKIRMLINQGIKQREIAGEFNVTKSCISRINIRKTWAHI